MSRKITTYDEGYKMSILREYYSSGMTRSAFLKKHNLPYANFLRWLRSYELENNSLPLQSDQSEKGVQVVIKDENVEGWN